MTESKETTILNEFLFSFLITKFYTINENVIYIPNEMEIYIEIPNCFENYLSKFGILNTFIRENITFEKMNKLDLSQDLINTFKRMLEINTNNKIEEFIKKNINIRKYSYHQVDMFIKLLIGQYDKFKSKLQLIGEKGDDATDQCITDFSKSIEYFIIGGFAKLLLERNDDNNKKKDYINLLSKYYEDDLKNTKYEIPLIFIIEKEEKLLYKKIEIEGQNKKSNDYLEQIKEALNLPNAVEKDIGDNKSLLSILNSDNYVITSDNFKKMILLIYRIRANVPVIIMGETGCGKTSLIKKLSQILNNGEELLKTINIHPGITDKIICEELNKINEEAEQQNKKEKEIWIFFDEINTCLSLSLLTEIFINRTYNGKELNKNIRLIGACNPYRRRAAGFEKYGLNRGDDNDEELVYLVQPLPQSLLYYVFSFGRINEYDEKKYIYSIIGKLFSKNEENLHINTTLAISKCHSFLRKIFDYSIVSLREISRFSKCVEFFQEYYFKKNNYENEDKNNKINEKKIKKMKTMKETKNYIKLKV